LISALFYLSHPFERFSIFTSLLNTIPSVTVDSLKDRSKYPTRLHFISAIEELGVHIENDRRILEPHEDERLRKFVEQFSCDDWVCIASQMSNQTPRQCRECHKIYLCPEVSIITWTEAEDLLLSKKFQQFGTKCAYFRPFFMNSIVNNIKNRWHMPARRKSQREKESTQSEDQDSPTRASTADNPAAIFDIAHLLNPPVGC
jgi:hypothetical protein